MGIYVEEYVDGRIISKKKRGINVDYKTAKNIRWV